jgi:hypothetical protein
VKTKSLLKNWSSVSAAAAALLGSSNRTVADKVISNDEPKIGDGNPYEPLILKPPGVKIIPEQRFAGHRSHASHASHASHYSGSGGYAPPAATPYYSPPATAAPVYPRASAVTSPEASTSPTPSPSPSPSAAANRIELVNGTVMYGTVLRKSAAGITMNGWDGKNYKFERKRLSARTIAELQLPPEEHSADGKQNDPKIERGDFAGLRQEKEDLDQTIATLRADNAALREQLRVLTAKPAATGPSQARTAQPPVDTSAATRDASQGHWISGTGKRHNKNCRYYGTGSGHPCGPNDGVPCKICGG